MSRIYQYRGGSSEGVVTPSTFSTPAAFTATQFKDSFGINIHVLAEGTDYYDEARILTKVQEIGCGRVRDGIDKNASEAQVNGLRAMVNAGIKVVLTVGQAAGGNASTWLTGQSAGAVQALKTTGTFTYTWPGGGTEVCRGYAGAFTELQGPNEWPLTGADWEAELRAWCDEHRTAFETDATLSSIPFYGPSMTSAQETIPQLARSNFDFFTAHTYRGGRIPEGASGSHGNVVDVVNAAKALNPNVPIIFTESGVHNATNLVGGFAGVSEEVGGHYNVREAFWNLSLGVPQTYFYEAFDQEPETALTDLEKHFGFYRTVGTGTNPSAWTISRKPVGDAFARLMTALADAGTGTPPSALPFRVVFGPGNRYVYPVSRKDGKYQIAVGMKNSLWDTGTATEKGFAVADSSGSLTLEFTAPSAVSSQRPSVDGVTTQLSTGITLNIPVDGKLTLLTVTA